MSGLKAKIQGDFEQHWRGMLSDCSQSFVEMLHVTSLREFMGY